MTTQATRSEKNENPNRSPRLPLAVEMNQLRMPVETAKQIAEKERQAVETAKFQQHEADRLRHADLGPFRTYLQNFLKKQVVPALCEVAKIGGHAIVARAPQAVKDTFHIEGNHHRLLAELEPIKEKAIIDSDLTYRVNWENRSVPALLDELRRQLDLFCKKNRLFAAIISSVESHESSLGRGSQTQWHTYHYIELWFSDRPLRYYATTDAKCYGHEERVMEDSRVVSIEDPHKDMGYD